MDLRETDGFSNENEKKHWWIKTRFCYIDKAISFLNLKNKADLSVVEFGHGSGQNLWYLKNKYKYKAQINKIIGVDPLLPLNLCTKSSEYLQTNDPSNIKPKSADIVLAMDVLEHIEDEIETLNQWTKTLRQEGIILITVPAFMSLWSHHDEFLNHKRRYTISSFKKISSEANLTPVFICYAFGPMFIPIFLIRKFFKHNYPTQDLKLPNFLLNTILYFICKIEYLLGGNRIIGTSVIAVLRKCKSYQTYEN